MNPNCVDEEITAYDTLTSCNESCTDLCHEAYFDTNLDVCLHHNNVSIENTKSNYSISKLATHFYFSVVLFLKTSTVRRKQSLKTLKVMKNAWIFATTLKNVTKSITSSTRINAFIVASVQKLIKDLTSFLHCESCSGN